MSVDGVDDAKSFDQLMVYNLTVSLVYNKLFNFVNNPLRSHVIFPVAYAISLGSTGYGSNL